MMDVRHRTWALESDISPSYNRKASFVNSYAIGEYIHSSAAYDDDDDNDDDNDDDSDEDDDNDNDDDSDDV